MEVEDGGLGRVCVRGLRDLDITYECRMRARWLELPPAIVSTTMRFGGSVVRAWLCVFGWADGSWSRRRQEARVWDFGWWR